LGFTSERIGPAGAMCNLEMARLGEIAINRRAFREFAHGIHRRQAFPEPAARRLVAPLLYHLAESVAPDRRARESAVPAAATPARAIRFEYSRADPVLFREEQRAGETGIAGADDDDFVLRLRGRLAIVRRRGSCGRGPVGGKMLEPGTGRAGGQRI